MNIFADLKKYAQGYEVDNSRSFTPEEIAEVASCTVQHGEYGLSCCFLMLGGYKHYIPLSSTSTACIGDVVDLTKAKILTLSRGGKDAIKRIEI